MDDFRPPTPDVPFVPATAEPEATPLPTGAGRWLAAGALVVTYFAAQLAIVIPVISWWVAAQGVQSPDAIESLIFSERGLWLTLIATGVSAALTIMVALGWPRLWRFLSSTPLVAFSAWFGWVSPQRLPLWMIPLGTVGLAVLASSLVYSVSGSAEVDAQLALFSTQSLQIGATLIVSSIVPVAEELIFRGALYSALESRQAVSLWHRHGLAVMITSLSFAAVHLLAGFETPASLLLITLFAFFLGALRAVTGSVQSTVVSHAVWNMLGSLALVASNNLPS